MTKKYLMTNLTDALDCFYYNIFYLVGIIIILKLFI